MIESCSHLESFETLFIKEGYLNWLKDTVIYIILDACSLILIAAPAPKRPILIYGKSMIRVNREFNEFCNRAVIFHRPKDLWLLHANTLAKQSLFVLACRPNLFFSVLKLDFNESASLIMGHCCIGLKYFYSLFERYQEGFIVAIETKFFKESISHTIKLSSLGHDQSKVSSRRYINNLIGDLLFFIDFF